VDLKGLWTRSVETSKKKGRSAFLPGRKNDSFTRGKAKRSMDLSNGRDREGSSIFFKTPAEGEISFLVLRKKELSALFCSKLRRGRSDGRRKEKVRAMVQKKKKRSAARTARRKKRPRPIASKNKRRGSTPQAIRRGDHPRKEGQQARRTGEFTILINVGGRESDFALKAGSQWLGGGEKGLVLLSLSWGGRRRLTAALKGKIAHDGTCREGKSYCSLLEAWKKGDAGFSARLGGEPMWLVLGDPGKELMLFLLEEGRRLDRPRRVLLHDIKEETLL